MKYLKLFFYVTLAHTFSLHATTPATTLNNHTPLTGCAVINLPTGLVNDQFTQNIFAMIDATFGAKTKTNPQALGFDPYQIQHFKKTYLYLIFVTKLEKVLNAKIQIQQNPKLFSTQHPKFAQNQTQIFKDFAQFLQDNNQSLPHFPSDTLVTSAGWNAVEITQQDLASSTAWQLYIKTMICDIYLYFSMVLQVIHNVEKQTFNYIPHFETSFYDADYTDLRTLNEMARIRLVLEDILKKRWHAQCIDWAKLPTITPKTSQEKVSQTLESAVINFRKSTFYNTIRSAHSAAGLPAGSTITNSNLLTGQQLASPLKEHVWCYYMLYEASGQLTSFLNAQNLQLTLDVCSESPLYPNIFPYRPDDYVLLDELIATKSKAEGNHTSSLAPSPKQYNIDKIRKPEHLQQTYRNGQREVNQAIAKIQNSQVQAQMWSLFKDLGHDFSQAWTDVKHTAEHGWTAIKNYGEAIGDGIAGIGAKLVGAVAEIGGYNKITDWGDDRLADSGQDFAIASKNLETAVDDFGDVLKDAVVAPIAEIGGDLVGFVLDDKKIGADIQDITNEVADSIVNVAAKLTSAIAEGSMEIYQVSIESAQLMSDVVDAATALFSGHENEFLKEGKQLFNDLISSIAQAYHTLLGATKSIVMSVLTGLGTIVNAITTLFIDLSREITFLFTGGIAAMIGNIVTAGQESSKINSAFYAAQARDQVSNVLEEHRSTINAVMGVVACVGADAAVDLISGGSASAADVAIDEAIMGATEAATETAATAAENTATALQTAAEQAQTAAEQAQTAAEQAQNATSTAQSNLNQAQDEFDNLPENASQEERVAARQKLLDAKAALKEATTTSEKLSGDAESLSNQAEQAGRNARQALAKAKNLRETALRATTEKTAKAAEDAADALANPTEFAQNAFDKASEELDNLPENASQQVRNAAEKKVINAKQALRDAQNVADALPKAQTALDQAQATLDDASEELEQATQNVEDLPEDASQETIDAAKQAKQASRQKFLNAKNALKQAQQDYDTVSQEAQNLTNEAEQAAAKAKQLRQAANQAKDSGTKQFTKNLAKNVKTKFKETIEDIKSLPKNLKTYAQDLVSKWSDIAERAAEDTAEKQAAQQAAQEAATDAQTAMNDASDAYSEALQGDDDAATAQAKQKLEDAQKDFREKTEKFNKADKEFKEAQETQASAEKNVKEIEKESGWGTARRYVGNTLKPLKDVIGLALKPIGLIMNITFNLGMIIGGYNQDAKNDLQMEDQTKILDNLWRFNNENKVSTAQQQLAFLEEMEQKNQANVGNQTLSLTLSQNIINANIMQLRASIASLFAPLYAQLLIPNPNTNLMLANIATSWNLQSDYVDLYPSQGFFTTTTGRPDFPFAQEIAQAPEITNLIIEKTKGSEKFWFNQRCTARDNTTNDGKPKNPTDPLIVTIDLQFLYTLNSAFHVGLYLGGNYHDYTTPNYLLPFLKNVTLKQAQNAIFNTNAGLAQNQIDPSIVDLDEAHLAKMIVLYRDSATSLLTLGVYEHESVLGINGWILQQPLPETAQIDQPHTYHLQATLNGTQLTFQLTVDNDQTPILNQTVTVTQLPNQRTYGMICSGAAIQWNQLQPKATIDTSARKKSTNTVTEIDLEKQNKIILAQASNPTFGQFKLKPISKQALIFGQYIYACTNTDLGKMMKGAQDSAIDFVIFGTHAPGATPVLGIDPTTAMKNAHPIIVSVINGTMYNQDGHSVGNVANVWDEYKKQYGPFSPVLDDFIKSQQVAIINALGKITFGSFKLDIVNSNALQAGQYIYTCSQTLKTPEGQPIIDSTTNKPMIDYLVCADVTATGMTIGMPPTATNATSLYSFITGNVYAKDTVIASKQAPTPTSTIATPVQAQLGSYASAHDLSSTDPVFTLISNTQISYANYTPPTPPVTTPVQTTVTPSTPAKPTHFKGVHLLFHMHHAQGPARIPGVHLLFKSKMDLGQRQRQAAGKVGYQLPKSQPKK